jgi:hypothetical protein
MKRGVRIILLALLAALLAGFIAGTVIRMRFERPVQYLGAVEGFKRGSDPFLNRAFTSVEGNLTTDLRRGLTPA